MVISELTRKISRALNTDNPRFEAELIVMKAAGLDRTGLIINSRQEADPKTEQSALEMALRRNTGEPIQYITGSAEFMSLEFEVNKSTLIPRQDTETLVEYTIDKIGEKEAEVLDIGTGTGCIGISIAHYCKNAHVTLLDISEKTLETAKKNAENNGVSVNTVLTDILKDYPKRRFDVITSNPPYIKSDVIGMLQTEVKDFEPVSALDGGGDGLKFYKRICSVAGNMLKDSGILIFETGYDQGQEVKALMGENGFTGVTVIKDLCGNDRVVSGRRTAIR